MIRAVQGHSIDVDLNLSPTIPPDILYHGTSITNIENIIENGIQRRKRKYVHLSKDKDTALQVGARHGKPVSLKIDAQKMHSNGNSFFVSKNGVWLVEFVPPEYISTK